MSDDVIVVEIGDTQIVTTFQTEVEVVEVDRGPYMVGATGPEGPMGLTGPTGPVPSGLSGTKTYWAADAESGPTIRKLTFTNGILTSET